MATMTRSWWGRRFIEALERFTDPARLGRGRSYATNGRVTSWQLGPGKVEATVRGSVNPYFGVYQEPRYATTIRIPPIDPVRWQAIIDHIGAHASLVTRLLLGEMPEDIEAAFAVAGCHLLPDRAAPFETRCSCPDWANPCKHVAGLYYVLAKELDRDPFLMFALRGLSREALLAALAKTPLGAALAEDLARPAPALEADAGLVPAVPSAPAPAAVSLREFWQGKGPLGDAPPATPAGVAALVIKREGDHPPFWPREGSFIEAMEDLYGRVRRQLE